MIGKKLALVRAGSGLSLRELSERMGKLVSAQAIAKYERNEMMPSSKVLIALADALDVSEDFLLGQSDIELHEVEFRVKKISGAREESQVKALVLSHLESYLELEEILQIPNREWDEPRAAPYPVRNIADAEIAAEYLRDHWKLGVHPIPSPGIRWPDERPDIEESSVSPDLAESPGLAEFLEDRGIKVLSLELPDLTDGMACWVQHGKSRKIPLIVINRNIKGERQRFTLAHELGHMVMDIRALEEADIEKAAHRFASAFLMPSAYLWAEIGKDRKSISLKELIYAKALFGVSVQAIAYRCKDLGIISEYAYRNLYRQFARLGWLKKPHYPEVPFILPEVPQRQKRLCFRAISEGIISESKGAELLGVPVRMLDKLLDRPSRDA